MRPLRALGPPLADLTRPMAYTAVQTLFEAGSAPRRHHYYKADYVAGISDDAIDTMIVHFARAPSPLSAVGFEPLGGAVCRVGTDETAFRYRDTPYAALILATWIDAAEPSPNIQWAREAWTALRPFSTGGVYVNYLAEEGEDRVKAAYGASYERLKALKKAYDPTNLFRLNQNIKPTL